MNTSSLWTKDFLLISIANFFLFLAFYILLVTLPVYAIDHLQSENTEAGLLTSVFLISAIIIRPFAGYWLERFGKKIILVVALCFFALPTFFYFGPDSIIGLLVIRLIHGIGFGMSTTATGAIVADLLPNSRRGEGMGYFVLSTTIAMVVGPFIGITAINQWSTTILFSICIFAALLALLLGLGVKLPELTTQQANITFQWKDLFEPSALPISLLGGLLGLVYASILSFVSVYANEIGLIEVSSYFFVVYAVVLLLSRPFTGRIFDLYGENWIIYPALLCFAAGMYVLGIVNSSHIFMFAAALIGLGWGTASPSFQTIAVQYAAPTRRGTATATYLSVFDFGIGVGSYVIGAAMSHISLGHIYQFSSLIIVSGIFMYYFIHGRKISKQHKYVQKA
ncbi:MFS transporter [Bacillus sp. DNRA2]|uniref:MFS transporter n=1 Tax=Bacillus sp. DNRA2 TaxID=2723053 RepID=UPI00145D92C9|nr:MFS transporter [Bacillus sp. DNRA2]NMD69949.1 MFS transporter [Bacillus sp. DNRA2]